MKVKCLCLVVFSMLFMYGCGSSSSSDTSSGGDTGTTLTESEAAGVVGYVMMTDLSAISSTQSVSAPLAAQVAKGIQCGFATSHACSNVPSGMSCEVTNCDDSGLDDSGLGTMLMAMTMTMASTSLCNVSVSGTFTISVSPVFTIVQHPPTSGSGTMYGTITVGSQTVTCGTASSPIAFTLEVPTGETEPQPSFVETNICSFNDGTVVTAGDIANNMSACM